MLLKRVALHTLLGIVLLLVVLLAASSKGSEERLEILTEDTLLHLEEHIDFVRISCLEVPKNTSLPMGRIISGLEFSPRNYRVDDSLMYGISLGLSPERRPPARCRLTFRIA